MELSYVTQGQEDTHRMHPLICGSWFQAFRSTYGSQKISMGSGLGVPYQSGNSRTRAEEK